MTAWTRDDLPERSEIVELSRCTYERGLSSNAFALDVLGLIVAHLNAHHPKPDGSFAVMLEDTHRAQRERDEALRKKGEAFDRAVRAERERDAAVARAEKAERDRDEADQ